MRSLRPVLDLGLCLAGFAFGVATAILSAFVSPNYSLPLLLLGIGSVAVSLAQGIRSIRSSGQHSRAIAELREGHQYLSQPESVRNMQVLMQHHNALRAAEQRFQDNFAVEEQPHGEALVRCNHCEWRIQEPLYSAWEVAVRHLNDAHAPKPPRRRLVPFGH